MEPAGFLAGVLCVVSARPVLINALVLSPSG
jgi:hypothetical protein